MEQTSSFLLGYRAILFQNVSLSSGFNITQQRHTLCNSIGYFWRHRRWKWSGRSDNSFNFIIKTPVQTYQTRNGQNALLCRNTNVSKPISDIYWNDSRNHQFHFCQKSVYFATFFIEISAILRLCLTEGGIYPQLPTQPKCLYTVQTNTVF